jgi:formate-nitrite transporter family protein
MSKENNNKQLKRLLHQQKEPEDILQEQIAAGLKEHRRPNLSLFFSAFTAGLEVGFSIFLMAIFYSMFVHEISASAMHFLLAAAYSLGFIFVIIGRSELFTEHTVLAVLPVLDKRAGIRSLASLWGIIFSGNLIGGYFFAFFLTIVGPQLGIVDEKSFEALANKMIQFDWEIILGSGLLAGWLMGLLSWMVASAQETISRILVVMFITTTIGLGGLHHCIVGSIEVFTGLISSPAISWSDYIHFQIWATVGNSVGGVVFVAILKFAHVKTSHKEGPNPEKQLEEK